MKSFDRAFVVWFIVAILIFGGLITLGFVYKKKISDYENYEKVLIQGAKSYISDGGLYPKKNEVITVDINSIIKSGYIKKKDVIDSCTGFIKVSKKKNLVYKPYIKCKYYHSSK